MSKALESLSLMFVIVLSIFFASTSQAAPWDSLKKDNCDEETAAPYTGPAMNANPCEGKGSSLVVSLPKTALFLCKEGKPAKSFKVALGLGGFGKTRDGDNKTPVGSYGLGSPRLSGQGFGVFIPIGYPTAEQTKKGFTGGNVGVHGPPRVNKCDGQSNVSANWTWGCVALSDDESIAEVADFVVKNDVEKIHLVGASAPATPAASVEMSMRDNNPM